MSVSCPNPSLVPIVPSGFEPRVVCRQWSDGRLDAVEATKRSRLLSDFKDDVAHRQVLRSVRKLSAVFGGDSERPRVVKNHIGAA